jgi:hypothetical protein
MAYALMLRPTLKVAGSNPDPRDQRPYRLRIRFLSWAPEPRPAARARGCGSSSLNADTAAPRQRRTAGAIAGPALNEAAVSLAQSARNRRRSSVFEGSFSGPRTTRSQSPRRFLSGQFAHTVMSNTVVGLEVAATPDDRGDWRTGFGWVLASR